MNIAPGVLRPVTYASVSEDASGNTFLTTALRIGGTSGPYHQLHMSDGNIFMEGSGEVGHIVKRLIDNDGTEGPLGVRTNPIFTDKRISQAGDGDFEAKTLFSADEEAERVIFKWDSKGIFATIGKSGLLGRQNEGYLQDGHVNPWYAINSEGSEHRYELGPGGASDMDVAFTRTGTQAASIQTGANSTSLQSKMTFYGDAIVPHQPITYPETATPSNPSAGNYKTYFKSDGNFYKLNSSGTEAQIGGGGMTLVGEHVITGSAEDTLTVTGITSSDHSRFRIEARRVSGSANAWFITANTDTAQTGYTRINYSGALTSNSSTIHGAVSGGQSFVADLIQNPTTQFNISFSSKVNFTSDPVASIYKNIGANISSVTLRSTTTGTFGAGSYLRVYQYN